MGISRFHAYAVHKALSQEGVIPPEVAEKAGELLGGIPGMWLHADIVQFLEEKNPAGEDEIIAAIIEWETNNPGELADTGLSATKNRDPRLGHVPAAQRKLFAERWWHRCPQCGEPIDADD